MGLRDVQEKGKISAFFASEREKNASKVLPNLLKNKDLWSNLLQNTIFHAALGSVNKNWECFLAELRGGHEEGKISAFLPLTKGKKMLSKLRRILLQITIFGLSCCKTAFFFARHPAATAKIK